MISVFWEGVEPDGKSSGEEVGGIGGNETIIGIYFIRLFSTRGENDFYFVRIKEILSVLISWVNSNSCLNTLFWRFIFQWHVFWNILWLAVQVLGVSAIVAHPIVSHQKIYPLFLESSIFVMGHGYLTRIVFSVTYCHEHLAMCMIHRCFGKMFFFLSLCMCVSLCVNVYLQWGL